MYGVYRKCVSGIFGTFVFKRAVFTYKHGIGYVEVDPCPTRQQIGVIRPRAASRILVSIGAGTVDITWRNVVSCVHLYGTRVRINRRVYVLFIYLHYFAPSLVVGFISDGSLAQLNVKSKNPIRQPPGLSCVLTGHFHRYGHSRLFLSTSIWAIFSRPTSATFDILSSSATDFLE